MPVAKLSLNGPHNKDYTALEQPAQQQLVLFKSLAGAGEHRPHHLPAHSLW